MAVSKRMLAAKSNQYNRNIHKRGKVNGKVVEKPRLSPSVLALIVFVVLGSAIFQLIRSAQGQN